ncbi:MAG TPA: DUF4154 domain-containing protein [Candidatus Marinimicrobia bacterium]|nr:DUF4154 domain-containing protein [Candidatus Neomarinimicrobiota bacterium]
MNSNKILSNICNSPSLVTKPKLYLFIFILFLVPVITLSQLEEYVIKAVFLERFTRFIEWPDSIAMPDTSKPFVIGIVGKNPFGATLNDLYSTQKIKNKPVQIRRIDNLNQINNCHLLFISKISKNKLNQILSITRYSPILTIGDSENYAKYGVLINFYVVDDKVRFEINETAVRSSGLKFSYLLFKAAVIINPIGNGQ